MTELQTTGVLLQKKGFCVRWFETKEQAAEALLEQAPPGMSVGIGGSVSIRELNVVEKLQARGPVYWHWLVPPSEMEAERHRAQQAGLYLCSSNALSQTGVLVNIDGAGNRVASMLYGPGRVLLVIGKNKLCPDVPAALLRIKNVACPQNARRHGMALPCATLGHCVDPELGCKAPDRMCRVCTLIEQPLRAGGPELWLVEEELGY